MKGLSAVVARDAESVVAVEEAIDAVRVHQGSLDQRSLSSSAR